LSCGSVFSTRSVDDLVKALGMEGVSKSQVSRLCGEIDERVKAFTVVAAGGEHLRRLVAHAAQVP
jgi:mutator family transposase